MRRLTIGLVVIGLLLVCTQASGKRQWYEKTLTEWGLPPVSEWVFQTSYYVDWDGTGLKMTICEVYLYFSVCGDIFSGGPKEKDIISEFLIFACKYPDRGNWYVVIDVRKSELTGDGSIIGSAYYDFDGDDFWEMDWGDISALRVIKLYNNLGGEEGS